ncbi:MAG TPA: hypothetical protein VMV18_08730 [bacterium]|nr:hypothetical protein [bacterium]
MRNLRAFPAAASLAAIAALALPATTLACGMASGVPGAATFRDADHLAALVSHEDDSTSWSELAAPFSSRTDVARLPTLLTWGSMSPAVVVSASGARMITFAPTAWAGADGNSVGLAEVTAAGVANVPVPGAQALNGFAAVISADGIADVLVSSDGAALHLLHGLPGMGPMRWTETARGDAGGCASNTLALSLQADGSLAGFCGDRPLAITGGAISVGDPVFNGVAPSALTSTLDASGGAVFYAVSPDASGETHQVARISRVGGAWTAEVIASLPLETAEDVAAARDGAIAIIGQTPNYDQALYALVRNGAMWTAEAAGKSEYGDRVSMADANGTLRILTGSMYLRLHERRADGTWATTGLGRLGYTTPMACEVGGALGAAPAAGPAMIGGVVLALAFVLRRRR